MFAAAVFALFRSDVNLLMVVSPAVAEDAPNAS
jgi:hypothetical protein